MKILSISLLLVILSSSAFTQSRINTTSPDGKIIFEFSFRDSRPRYSITFNGKSVIQQSELDLGFNNLNLTKGFRTGKTQRLQGLEEYELAVGKTKKVREAFKQITIPLISPQAQVNLVVKLFNDGLALRYEFISAKGQDSLVLTDERTTFNLPDKSVARTLLLPNYISSHEGRYSSIPIEELKEGSLMDMPTLFEIPGGTYLAITEAALVDYAGMYLTKENKSIRSMLSPWPGQTSIKVKAVFPHKSPWRVIMISDRIGAMIESNILTNLNEPSLIKDTSWLKPGKTTFPWWNGNVLPDTLNAPGNNFVTQQYYIDFCARNGIEYHSVVEYGLHQWYVDDGIGFSPGPHPDVTKPVPGLNMKQVCDYGKSKGVGIRVWVHWAALYPKLDSAFAIFEKWGLQGMMVDFMDRDDQKMVNIQNKMLKKAAEHHLHIQFHGAYKPTGLNRTYQNEFTREATLNYEINKWDSKGLSPDDDIMIPFTRMLAGSTDYHMGGFRAVPKEKFVRQYTRPLMLGTRCHQLGMYVVLENYLGMVCDYPEAYEGQPGFDFVQNVPTVWDETKVVDAKVGEYIIIARRKGSDWFVGGITNHTPRSLKFPLDFLSVGSYSAKVFSDASDVAINPNHLDERVIDVASSEMITVELAGGGGLAMHIIKK